MTIKIGDAVRYESNKGITRVREVGGISNFVRGKTFLVDNDNQGTYHYHVSANEVLEVYTREEHPEHFL